MTNARENAINEIARESLGLETLETRRMDGLDFHDLAVWSIKDALERAYEAGLEAARSETNTSAPDTVPPTGVCPRCGQNNPDQLVWDDDGESITCQACGTNYTIHPIN